ncbi:transcription factor subunit Med10 of mediator complex-domain-containing protein [Multifurca ochricompacta]|uniref:Mediator of RNA polymerase II transcription subunit 10 n=1 Tax=Multifurca ochricompacta TaxID=376703 RepID=A0AAD4M523_9AGAM|nr:transcription factor subunit Med10 of mediator complex-domain-containing protein [Multifurca ochricompacta]
MPPRPLLIPVLVPPLAPDSPRSAQSIPPTGIQGDLEQDIMGLANALYNLGTTVVNDSTKDPGAGKQVGLRVNEVVGYLAGLDEMASHYTTRVPMQILTDIDNGRNPMHLTKDRLERTAAENQFMNGKIKAIESYRKLLNEALVQTFPDLIEVLPGANANTVELQAQQPVDGSVESASLTNGVHQL